jgi:hypothetical protein
MRFAVVATCAFSISGCATVTSIGDFSVPDVLKTASGYYHLPRTILNVKVTPAVGPTTPTTISVAAAAESDPQASVLFNIEHSPLFDDVIEVKTDASGLLQSVASDSKDRTGDIAVNLAKLVFTSQTGGADLPNVRSLPANGGAIGPGFAASYDPFDSKQAHTVKQALARANFCILVGDEIRTVGSRSVDAACTSPPPQQPTELIAASYAGRNPGIFYRRPIPIPIQIYQRTPPVNPSTPNHFELIWTGNELFFDKTALYRVEVDRSAFVEKKVTLSFTSGALADIKVENPSEILGVTNSLVQVAQIIFAIPLAGFKQDKQLIDAQTDLLNSQSNYIKAQQSLLKLQQQSTDGRTLVFTPTYLEGGRGLQVPGGGTLNSVEQCERDFQLQRDQCVALINKDATQPVQ